MSDQMAETEVVDSPEESPPVQPDVEQRLSKLERALDEERAASAGKDRKITEQSAVIRQFQEETLSQEKLNELRADELRQQKDEWEKTNADKMAKLAKLENELLKRETLANINGFPMEFAQRVVGETAEEIEMDARALMRDVVGQRDLVESTQKVTGPPRSGTVKRDAVTARNLEALPPGDAREWAAGASDQEFEALITEQQKQA